MVSQARSARVWKTACPTALKKVAQRSGNLSFRLNLLFVRRNHLLYEDCVGQGSWRMDGHAVNGSGIKRIKVRAISGNQQGAALPNWSCQYGSITNQPGKCLSRSPPTGCLRWTTESSRRRFRSAIVCMISSVEHQARGALDLGSRATPPFREVAGYARASTRLGQRSGCLARRLRPVHLAGDKVSPVSGFKREAEGRAAFANRTFSIWGSRWRFREPRLGRTASLYREQPLETVRLELSALETDSVFEAKANSAMVSSAFRRVALACMERVLPGAPGS